MKKLIVLLYCTMIGFLTLSQNSSWIVAPEYIPNILFPNFSPPLPTGPATNDLTNPFDYYDGVSPHGSANMITDLNGDIRFFIIDGLIYDEDGAFVNHTILGNYLSNFIPSYDNSVSPAINKTRFDGINANYEYHGKETLIVPHPTNCNRYYIFGTMHKIYGSNLDPAITSGAGTAYFSLYDAATKEVVTSGAWYGYADINASECFPEINATSVFNSQNTVTPAQNNGDTQMQDATWSQFLKFAYGMGLAAVKGSNVNETFVLSQTGNGLYIIKIEATGNVRYWKRYNNLAGSSYSEDFYWINPSELEAVYDNNLNNFKMARAIKSITAFGEYSDMFTATFDPNFLALLDADVTLVPDFSGQGRTINGLEFSPDKNKVLFTSTIANAPSNYNSLHYINLVANPPTFNNVVSGTNQFQNSFIELGVDANLYMSTPGGLYRMSNPSTPNGNNITLIANIPINGCFDQFSGTDPNLRLLRNYTLPDNIDFYDYSVQLASEACCVINQTYYNQLTYTANVATELWRDNSIGSNPLLNATGSTVYIRDELRIPAGATITIRDMTLKFAPNARVVIENGPSGGQGGKLILEGTTVLTVDDNCGDFWLGVEVWGNTFQPQGNPNSSSQGVLKMFGTLSRIEYARIGVLCSKRSNLNTNTSFDVFRNGGIVFADNSPTFVNNQIGVYLSVYSNASNNGMNMSKFVNATFYWDQNFSTTAAPIAHLQLDRVHGIKVIGCDFRNDNQTIYAPIDQGVGIKALLSTFNVSAICLGANTPNDPCLSYQFTKFTNLNIGIWSDYLSPNLGFTVKQSLFKECIVGIYSFKSGGTSVVQSDFIVRDGPYQTVGMYLDNCNAYTVQENKFEEFSAPLSISSYGMVVRNSGQANNEVYKNNFQRLHIGCQSDFLNANQSGGPINTGLKWICNNFRTPITEADMAINGVIHQNQGMNVGATQNEVRLNAARNVFSTNDNGNSEHDIKVANPVTNYWPYIQNINYVHLGDQISSNVHFPNDRDFSVINATASTFGGFIVNPAPNFCPTKIKTISGSSNSLLSKNAEIENLEAIILHGGRNELLQRILDYPDDVATRDTLLNTGSVLSDEVLQAYIDNCTISSYVREVMIYNSSLSEQTKQRVISSDLPVSTRIAIMNAQGNPSERREVYAQLENSYFDYDTEFYQLVGLLAENASETGDDALLIATLTQVNQAESKKFLLGHYMSRGDLVNAQLLLTELGSTEHPDYISLMQIIEQLNVSESIQEELTTNTSLFDEVQTLTQSENDEVASSAQAIMDFSSRIHQAPYVLPLSGSSAMTIQQNQANDDAYSLNTNIMSIYPNPSTGKVYFDLPNQDEDHMVIQLFDLTGKQIAFREFQKTNGELIDFSDVKKGTYMVRITLGTDYTESQLLNLE